MAEDLFHLIGNLDTELNVPGDGKTSKVVFQDEHVKAVLFGFAAGNGLTEHTAPMPGILYFVRGEAKISLGDHQSNAVAGTWVHMEPNLPHSIHATSETVMLLLMVKCGKPVATIAAHELASETSD